MRISEIINQGLEFAASSTRHLIPLSEMAYRRRAIREKLRALQRPINSHILKLIIFRDNDNRSHWKRELIGWGDDLADMKLRGLRGTYPMGFDFAWEHLYREPFEGTEIATIQFNLDRLHREYSDFYKGDIDPNDVLAKFTRFLREFCHAIGEARTVANVVNEL